MANNRAEYSYIHNGKEGISTAFNIDEKAEILLQIPRALGTTRVALDVFDESCSRHLFSIEAEWGGFINEYDQYTFNLKLDALGGGLYFMRPRLITLGKELFGHKWAGGIYFDDKGELTNMMQLTVCSFAYAEPKKIRGGVIYHIFVDRFRRGGIVDVPDGARVVRGEWKIIAEYPDYPGAMLYNNTFWGGTLWGIIDKLDYIKSLGTTCIYLSPIFRAYSNHKYDTADYMTIDPIFGGEEAFIALVKACKKKGIEIILDGVFNHTGSDSIYFNKYGRYEGTGAYQSRKSDYFDWYDFQVYPTKYTSWWGIDILPRINPDNPNCGKYFVGKGGVIEKYRDMGIYGYRLDVADELSDDFISKIKARLGEDGEDRILYGEVWEDASNKCSYGSRRRYYQGNELDGVMNYPLRKGIIDYICGKGTDNLAYALTDVSYNAPERVLHNQMNLLGTHDTERILTVLGDENVDGLNNHQLARLRMSPERRGMAVNRLINAYTILATVPGIPTIFYGDEAGLEGYRDPFNRMPFPWNREDMTLVEHYKTLGRIRSEHKVYDSGDYRLINLDRDLLIFARYIGDMAYLTVVNNSTNDMCVEFSEEASELITGEKSESFTLSALTSRIYMVRRDSDLEIN